MTEFPAPRAKGQRHELSNHHTSSSTFLARSMQPSFEGMIFTQVNCSYPAILRTRSTILASTAFRSASGRMPQPRPTKLEDAVGTGSVKKAAPFVSNYSTTVENRD
jgi:hypothetical protein